MVRRAGSKPYDPHASYAIRILFKHPHRYRTRAKASVMTCGGAGRVIDDNYGLGLRKR